jgi:Grx4 family monothiol glutaredoxin
MTLSESLRKQISELLASNRVVLFMKGTRRMPGADSPSRSCGSSTRCYRATKQSTRFVHPELRHGIKEFSQWPTIPQLYVGGQFIGGCDIVRKMNASGDLQKLIGADHGTAIQSRTVMSSLPANLQGSVIDALSEVIERQIHNSRATVNGGGHFSIEVTSSAFAGRSMLERPRLVYDAIARLMQGDAPPVHAVDSLKTRTPSRPEPVLAGHGWPPASEIQRTIGVQT